MLRSRARKDNRRYISNNRVQCEAENNFSASEVMETKNKRFDVPKLNERLIEEQVLQLHNYVINAHNQVY